MESITFKENGTVQEEIKKSKFICHVKRVSSEEEARNFINAIKKEHYKATHNCSAFIIGEHSDIKRTSDDGEPSGTAGVPMLGVLEKHHITNSCVVVTRYFGGIKLGAGGLIRAYASSVAQAVLGITLTYSQYQEFANFLKDHQLVEQDPTFTDQVTTTIFVNKEDTGSITEALVEFYNGKVIIEDQGIREVEVPLLSPENE